MRILICDAQVPFAHGGAEILVRSLHGELKRRGHQVDVVTVPYNWKTREQLLAAALPWRLIDLERVDGERVDLVIATRFPSYLVRHPNKVVWLVHQLRQIYDLKGTRHSDFGDGERDAKVIEAVRAMDRQGLGEARRVFTISRNTADRLVRFNDLAASVLYPPPRLAAAHHAGPFGDYVFSAGRLDPLKRFDQLLRAVAACARPVRCRIAGVGTEREPLLELAKRLGIADRVDLLGWVSDERLVEEYAGALAVYYAPFDEDYGYVTLEGFLAAKPVLTTADAGGVLEFVRDGINGFVAPAESTRALATALDRLFDDRPLAERLGEAGRQSVAAIGWDSVIDGLLAEA
ncbi:MAG: glycosyltransferase family 4 protein [Acidobacteriota bacterium]